MIGIVFGLLLWCPAILGWGILVRRTGGHPANRRSLELADVPAGYLALTGLAIGLNFFVPLDRGAAAITCAAGWVVLLVAWRSAGPGEITRSVTGPVVAGLAVALAASQPVHYGYDAMLYHLQTMQWAAHGTVPLGLANLSGRYGYNSGWLTLATLVRDPFDLQPLEHAILLPGTLLVFALVALRANWSQARASLSHRIGAIGGLAMASPTVYFVVNSTAQDVVPLVAWIAAVALTVRAYERPEEADDRFADVARVASVAVLSKLSAITLLVLPAGMVLSLPATGVSATRSRVRLVVRAAWLPVIVFALWAARGVALSGCLTYPASVTCFAAVPWAVSADAAQTDARIIRNWARQPYRSATEPVFPGWVRGWLERAVVDVDIMLPVAFLLAAAVALVVAGQGARAPPGGRQVGVAIAVAIVFWLVAAPDPRFGAGPLWALGAFAAAWANVGVRGAAADWRKWLAPAIVFVAWATVAMDSLREVSRPLRVPGISVVLGTPHLSIVTTPRMRVALTATGDTIWVPLRAREEQCFLAPLPCAPGVPAGLVVVRDPSGTIAGFRNRSPTR